MPVSTIWPAPARIENADDRPRPSDLHSEAAITLDEARSLREMIDFDLTLLAHHQADLHPDVIALAGAVRMAASHLEDVAADYLQALQARLPDERQGAPAVPLYR